MRALCASAALSLLLFPTTLSAAPPIEITAAQKAVAERIRAEGLRADIRFLSSDLLEGRGPATRGDQLAEQYVASRLEALGVEPGAPDGSFFQPVDVVGVTSHAPETLTVRKATGSTGSSPSASVELRQMADFIAFSSLPRPEVSVEDAEIVFVGYGIVAPEYRWDDYKGADLKGKVLLFMNNDPEDDPAIFAGKTRLYYGRWTYKYEIAAQKGAAGAIIIHTTPSAGYPWQVVETSWGGEQFFLPDQGLSLPVSAWTTEEATRRIVQLAGKNLDQLRRAAQKRSFRPVPLGVTLRLTLKNDVEKKRTGNVVGKVTGSDPLLAREAVLFTAHHDHLGKKGDAIYHGAVDNASGVAGLLAIATAVKALPKPPERTLFFVAVAGEEQGLLGSRFFATHPPIPPGRMVADINMDTLNVLGKTRDVAQLGRGKSNLDSLLDAVAATQGRVVVPDPEPDKGAYYRSDHFSFAQVGVPAVYIGTGSDFVGRPPGWGVEKKREFESHDYHQPSDLYHPEWDLSGAVEDVQLLFLLGVKLAGPGPMPEWTPGDEFAARRKEALAAVPKG